MASRATTGLAHEERARGNPFRSQKVRSNIITGWSCQYLPPNRRHLISSMTSAIAAGQALLVLVGDRGCGKSELLDRVVNDLYDSARSIFLRCRDGGSAQLPASILGALGVLSSQPTRTKMLDTLTEAALQQRSAGKRLLLVLDDASQLTNESIEAVLEIGKLENGNCRLIQVVLSGEPAFCDRVSSLAGPTFGPAAIWTYRIPAFSASEIGEYIEYRLQTAGEIRSDVFAATACARIAEISGGIPATINSLCEKALDIAWRESKRIVDSNLIAQVAVQSQSDLWDARNQVVGNSPTAPAYSLNSIIPGEPDLKPFSAFVGRRRLIFMGGGIVALLLIIAAILHNGTSPDDFIAQNKPLSSRHQLDLKAHTGGRAGSSSAEGSRANLNSGASKNFSAFVLSQNRPLTLYKSPSPLPKITRSGDGEPQKPQERSIIGRQLSKDGARLLSTGNYDDAIKTFQTALIADPGNPDILGAIERANKAKAAEQAIASDQTNKSIKDVNGSVSSYRIPTQAVSQHHKQRPESAVQAQDALQVGQKLLALGNYDEAIKAFRAGLMIDPQNELLHMEMARARSAQTAEEQVLGSP